MANIESIGKLEDAEAAPDLLAPANFRRVGGVVIRRVRAEGLVYTYVSDDDLQDPDICRALGITADLEFEA